MDIGSEQDRYFRKLMWVYDINDFSVQNTFSKGKEEYYTTARSYIGEVLPIDHYRLFPGELVLDFEHNSLTFPTHKVLKLSKNIVAFCNTYDINCYPFFSGGSGIHIHMFCKDCIEKNILLKILSKEFNLEDYMEHHLLDTHILHGAHLIRAPGGRKHSGDWVVYKSFVEILKLNKYSLVTSKDRIMFPDLREMNLWEYNPQTGLLTSEELADAI
jgi:hypothetical protein